MLHGNLRHDFPWRNICRPLNFTIGGHFLANTFSGLEKTQTFFLMRYPETKYDTPHSTQELKVRLTDRTRTINAAYCSKVCRTSESDYTSAVYQMSWMSTGTSNSQDVRYG